MPLIKSAHAPATLVPFAPAAVEAQAAATLALAAGQAQDLRRDARQEGYAEGHRQGLEAGRQQALTDFGQALRQSAEHLLGVAGELGALHQRLQTQSASHTIELALAIARRIVGRGIHQAPAAALEGMRQALRLVGAAAPVRIAVHPQLMSCLQLAAADLLARWPGAQVPLVEDAALPAAGWVIHSEHGCVSGDIDQQLDRIAAELCGAPEPATPPIPAPSASP